MTMIKINYIIIKYNSYERVYLLPPIFSSHKWLVVDNFSDFLVDLEKAANEFNLNILLTEPHNLINIKHNLVLNGIAVFGFIILTCSP